MPFKSEKQRRYLYSQKPEVARKFAKDSKKSSTNKKWNDLVKKLKKNQRTDK